MEDAAQPPSGAPPEPRRARPDTRYVVAGPEVWSLIRAAYLAGHSAPTLSARFGVSVGSIRRRAGRDGWTKRALAEAAHTGALPPRPGEGGRVLPPLHGEGDRAATGWGDAVVHPDHTALIEAWCAPTLRPPDLARRGLAQAARALVGGEALNALRLARAAAEIHRLDTALEWADHVDDDFEEAQTRRGRMRLLRVVVRDTALMLARRLAAGEPLPDEYADIEAGLDREDAAEAEQGEGDA